LLVVDGMYQSAPIKIIRLYDEGFMKI
jgi:hypothetical protein